MTTRYLFEISPHIIKLGEPLDFQRSFVLDLTEEQLQGIYIMAVNVNAVSPIAIYPARMRIYKWSLEKQTWERYIPPLHQRVPNHVWLGDIEVDADELINNPRTPYILFDEVLVPSLERRTFQKYVYVLRDFSRNTIQVYTSNTLEMLQGMISLTSWLGVDWSRFILYVFENRNAMQIV